MTARISQRSAGGFQQAGYAVGAVVVDAALFVPQSRPRLFVIGVHQDVELPECMTAEGPSSPWHTRTLKTAYEKLAPKTKQEWIWWNLPVRPNASKPAGCDRRKPNQHVLVHG